SKIWSIYLSESEKYDKVLVENWKGDTDGILIFTGLFSATVSAFIVESYKNLQPDSGDTAVVLLAQISQQLAASTNGTRLPAAVVPNPNSFRPSSSTVRVNVLWFMSLILSLTCALSATLIQQWARRYMVAAQRHAAPRKQGLIHTYLFAGVTSFQMMAAVQYLPTLLHASVFLFFTGLVEFI
ncbi:hypothetical protein BV25DRAFT_1788559, partial [Artomyces pyxidatus]